MGNFINDIAEWSTFGIVDDLTGSEAAEKQLREASAASSAALQNAATGSNNALYGSYLTGVNYLDPYRMAGMGGFNQYLANLGLNPQAAQQMPNIPLINNYASGQAAGTGIGTNNTVTGIGSANMDNLNQQNLYPLQQGYANTHESVLSNGGNQQNPYARNLAPQYMGYNQQAPGYSGYDQQLPQYSGYDQQIPEYSGYNQQIPEYSGYDVPDPGMFDAGNYSTYGFQDPGSFEFDESQVSLDPGYLFRQRQGEKALNRQLSAMGMGSSGAAVKDAMRYNQGFASDEYGKAYARQYGQQSDEYQSDLGAYGREYGRAQDMYNTDVQSWQRGAAQNMQDYMGSVDQWERGAAQNWQDYMGATDQWQRGAAQNLQDYQGSVDQWERGAAQNLQNYMGATDAWDRGYNANLQDFGVQYGQWNDQMNRLSGIADIGYTTSGSLADLAMAYGAGYGNNLMTGAGAQATNLMNQGNIGANAATSGWNTLMDLGGLGASLYGGYQTGNLASALSGGV